MLDESAQSMPKVCVAGPAKVPSLLNVTYVLSPCVIASPLSSVETVSLQVAPSGFRSEVTWELPTATCLRSDRLTRMVQSLASPFQSTRSDEQTSELQSLKRIHNAHLCIKK